MQDLDKTLEERKKTHGAYSEHARITQNLKQVIKTEPNYVKLSYEMKETLDMTFHKIGRIIAGDPWEIDHWIDIAGYNTLVAKEIEKRR